MVALKLYYDLLSQPARAVWLFLKVNYIPFIDCPVALRRGEHFKDDYKKINPFQKVPMIEENGFKLTESGAILKYLSTKHDVSPTWYPQDLYSQIKVDEYLFWHQANIRFPTTFYFRTKVLDPMTKATAVNWQKLQEHAERSNIGLDYLENEWLKNKFLCGDSLSIADLVCVTELEQPMACGLDILDKRPKLKKWMFDVRGQLEPHYDEAHVYLWKLQEKLKASSKI